METMLKWNDIPSFREVVTRIQRRMDFHGLKAPTIRFQGRVKLHGTNAGIRILEDFKLQPQSRERLLTIQSDNAGFAAFVAMNEQDIRELFRYVLNLEVGDTVYGEWIGPGIQKGVALSQLPAKQFVIFGMRKPDESNHPVPMFVNAGQIFHIDSAPIEEITIDFSVPSAAVPTLEKLTDQYETECPWGKKFGISGIGEGLVWTPVETDFAPIGELMFKTKGDKHGNPATNEKAKISWTTEQINSVNECVDLVLPGWRLQQGLQHVPELSKKHTGTYLAWINADVLKEELDRLKACIEGTEMDMKFILNRVSVAARRFYLEECDKV